MNIVLAYNDTEASNRALERAAALCKLHEARLVVTSITPFVVGPAPDMSPGPELQRADGLLRELGVEAELVEAIGEIAVRRGRGSRDARCRSHCPRDSRAEPSRADARSLRVGAGAANGPLRRPDRPLSG